MESYVREHPSRKLRKSILWKRGSLEVKIGKESTALVRGSERKRKQRRKRTLNRSPHGNKTAREQLAQDIWQRKRKRVTNGEKCSSNERKSFFYPSIQTGRRKRLPVKKQRTW
jgi:hypothetical protein